MKDEFTATSPRWTGVEIFGVVLIALLCQLIAQSLLDAVGWFGWYYGDVKPSAERARLWTTAVGTTLQIVATLAWFRHSSGATLTDLGMITPHWKRNVLAGFWLTLIFAPGTYGIHLLAALAMKSLGVEEQHEFTRLGDQPLTGIEWTLLVVAAVVLAPVWEELLFRGILQPWATSADHPRRGQTLLIVAAMICVLSRMDYVMKALEEGGKSLAIEALPPACLAAVIPVYALLLKRSVETAGIFATAVLFAWIHVRVWPTPIPLLWLALGLGWLRWKSGNVVGCIVMHALFNAIGCALLPWIKTT